MRINKLAKSVALVVVMAMLMSMTVMVSAAETATDIDVVYDYTDESVEISATHPGGAGEVVTVVVADGSGNEVYWNDAVADENGVVEFSFNMDPSTDNSGSYSVSLGGDGLDDTTVSNAYIFTNDAGTVTFLALVNNKTAAELEENLVTNAYGEPYGVMCGAGSDFNELTGKTAVLEELANKTYTSAGDFLDKFNVAVTIQLFNEERVSNVVATYKNVFGFDTVTWYGRILGSAQKDTIEDELVGKGFDLDDKAAVVAAFDKATALALYNDMTNETKGNLRDYIVYTNGATYTNIDLDDFDDELNDSGRLDVMNTMVAANFANFAAVESTFEDAIADAIDAMNDRREDHSTTVGGGISGNITVTPVAPSGQTFNDLAGVEWAAEAINALAAKGIINGVAAGTFAPNNVLTREQFVKILVGAHGLSATGTVPFADVDANAWYYGYVVAAYNSGIVNGVDAASFGIGASLTREQLCTMAYRAIKTLGINLKMVNAPADFADNAEISDWAKEAVSYLYQAGIVNGVGEGKFAPKAETTRAMGAKIIYGILEGGVK